MTRKERTPRPKPVRPTLTPAFACGCAFWAGDAALYSLGYEWAQDACVAGALVSLALALLGFLALYVAGRHMVALLMASVLVGACLGCAASATCHADTQAAAQADFSGASVELLEDTRESGTGECAFARVTCEDGRQLIVYADIGDREPALLGDRFVVSGSFSAPIGESGVYLWRNGAVGRLRIRSCERSDEQALLAPLLAVRARAIAAIGDESESQALLQALVCGYRRTIKDTALYARFQACGLAHLVAVSGAHLVIVTGLFAAAFKALRVPRCITVALLIVIMGTYLVVAGMPVSAIRATIMSSIGILSIVGRRRPSALNALGIGAFIVVGSSPAAAISASFALSMLSTAGIVLFAPLVQSWLESTPLVRVPFAVDTLSLTLAAGVLSQLYACSMFHQLPLAGPLANVVCAPLFPLVCGFGLVTGALGALGALALPIALPASACAQALVWMVNAVSSLPFASIPIAISSLAALGFSVGAAVLLWVTWPSLKMKAVLPAVLALLSVFAVFAFRVAQEDAIVMLDVGQGDAFLVRSRGQTILIDTGNRDGQLLEQLALAGAYRLNGVVVTHSDDDHCGSLDALERGIRVDRVFLAEGISASSSDKNAALVDQARRTAGELVELRAGDRFRIGAFQATVVWPYRLEDDGGNADSVCLYLEYDGDDDGAVDFTALFTGDVEQGQLEQMIDDGAVSKVDVLKVAHHGSRNGMNADEAEVLKPRIALIGVGANNRYGHPTRETLNLLDAQGCRTYRSDLDGQVKILFTPRFLRAP